MKREYIEYKYNNTRIIHQVIIGLANSKSLFVKAIFKSRYMLLLLLALSVSCSDYLELQPKDNLVQSEFWQNKEQVNSAVAACYASMNENNFMSRYIAWGELRAEMLVSVKASGDQQDMMKGFNKVSSSLMSWASFYKTINYCNMVLAYAQAAQELDATFSERQLRIYEGEALAIRSMVYLILVKNFKEVPLVVTATLNDKTDFYVEKEKENVIIDKIIEDLNVAIKSLPEGYAESDAYDKGRITKGAALAILADAYLWSSQYDKCIEACDEIIALNKYSLVDGSDWFTEIFFEGNSSEGIFELQFDDIFSTLRSFFYVSNPTFKAFSGIADVFPEDVEDSRGKLASYDPANNAVFKFAGVDPQSGEYRANTQFYNTWIFYRYADVLLMKAEACLMSTTRSNLDEVYELINTVYQRSTGLPLEIGISQGELEDALLLERQREFAFEGKRWYDLLRFARRNNFQQQQLILEMAELKTTSDDYLEILSNYSDTASYFLPIYSEEIYRNPNLEQNPYYQY